MEETVKWVRKSSPTVMKVIRHAGVDSRMILFDDQQLTCHFKLSLQCNVSPITLIMCNVYIIVTWCNLHIYTTLEEVCSAYSPHRTLLHIIYTIIFRKNMT